MPRIMVLAVRMLCAQDSDEAEQAFAALAVEDLVAAAHLGIVLDRALPGSGPLWMAIMERAKNKVEVEYTSDGAPLGMDGRPLDLGQWVSPRRKSFRWGKRDATDTADELAARMGWRDMERA